MRAAVTELQVEQVEASISTSQGRGSTFKQNDAHAQAEQLFWTAQWIAFAKCTKLNECEKVGLEYGSECTHPTAILA